MRFDGQTIHVLTFSISSNLGMTIYVGKISRQSHGSFAGWIKKSKNEENKNQNINLKSTQKLEPVQGGPIKLIDYQRLNNCLV